MGLLALKGITAQWHREKNSKSVVSAAREVCLMCAGTGMEWLTLPQSLLCLPQLHSFYLTSVFFLAPVYSNYGTLTSTLCLTGSLLEMQHLRPHADLLNHDLRIYKVQIL